MAERCVWKWGETEKRKFLLICIIAKYAFALVFPLLCVIFQGKSWGYLAAAVAEIALVLCVTELLVRVRPWLAYIPNTLLLFFINGQFAVLYWGSTFVSAPMLDNLDSIRALSGKAVLYILTAVLVVAFSALPVCSIKRVKLPILLGVPVALYLAVIGLGFIQYSPFSAAIQTYKQMTRWNQLLTGANGKVDESEFFQTGVGDYRVRPEELSSSPNVILVFVEGLSQNIIDDPRNIMPNLRRLQGQGITFENYYNHTFATYMALSGQLYSGYQHNLRDKNYLVSLQDIFSHHGYQTTFINTEPNNADFTSYLADFEFDTLINDMGNVGKMGFIYDKNAYEMLYDMAEEMAKAGRPFFLSMYSFGTHVGCDGMDQKYGDGSDPLLNKFYDVDVQIGRFLERFRDSDLAEDTLLVFTTDHASYVCSDFVNTFPDYVRATPQIDRIPLVFYYEGVSPETLDVAGRSSIDMAPTLLDLLDMTSGNFFLGESLFAQTDGTWASTVYESNGAAYSTANGNIRLLEKEEQEKFEKRLVQYFTLKMAGSSSEGKGTNQAYAYAAMNEDGTALDISIENADEFVSFRTAVWSLSEGQDDLKWFASEREEEGTAKYSVDFSDFVEDGSYSVHIYGFREGEEEMSWVDDIAVNVSRFKDGPAETDAGRSE